jgi:hypothetical protein
VCILKDSNKFLLPTLLHVQIDLNFESVSTNRIQKTRIMQTAFLLACPSLRRRVSSFKPLTGFRLNLVHEAYNTISEVDFALVGIGPLDHLPLLYVASSKMYAPVSARLWCNLPRNHGVTCCAVCHCSPRQFLPSLQLCSTGQQHFRIFTYETQLTVNTRWKVQNN